MLCLKQGIAPPDPFGLISPRGDQGLSNGPGFVAQQLFRTVHIRKKPEGGMKLGAENPVGMFQVFAPVVEILIHQTCRLQATSGVVRKRTHTVAMEGDSQGFVVDGSDGIWNSVRAFVFRAVLRKVQVLDTCNSCCLYILFERSAVFYKNVVLHQEQMVHASLQKMT